jgi:protein-S-isoprenylcysteine O-methyltransferase Ste14
MSIVFTHPGAEVLFWGTFAIWAIGERILQIRDWKVHGIKYGDKDRGSYFAVLIGVGGGLAGAVFLSRVSWLRIPGAWVWLALGLVVAWTGLVLRGWAVRTLGEYFITKVEVEDDQVVVTGGPYKWVRHPSYSGLLLAMAGFGLAMGNVGSLLALSLLPLLGTLPRIRVEERALEATLGDQYKDYEKDRPRLIPRVW